MNSEKNYDKNFDLSFDNKNLELIFLPVTEYRRGDPTLLRITAQGRIFFAGKMISAEYNFDEVKKFAIGINKNDLDDKSLYLLPNPHEDIPSISWSKDREFNYLSLKSILDVHNRKYPDSIDYSIIKKDGKQIIRLHTHVAEKKEKKIINETEERTIPKRVNKKPQPKAKSKATPKKKTVAPKRSSPKRKATNTRKR